MLVSVGTFLNRGLLAVNEKPTRLYVWHRYRHRHRRIFLNNVYSLAWNCDIAVLMSIFVHPSLYVRIYLYTKQNCLCLLHCQMIITVFERLFQISGSFVNSSACDQRSAGGMSALGLLLFIASTVFIWQAAVGMYLIEHTYVFLTAQPIITLYIYRPIWRR